MSGPSPAKARSKKADWGREASKGTASRDTPTKAASASGASKDTASRDTPTRARATSTRTTGTRSTRGSRPTKVVAGSHRRLAPGSRRIGDARGDEWLEVTVIVRPRSSVPLPSVEELGRQRPRERRHLDRRRFVEAYGATGEDIEAVASFARAHHLDVVQSSAARRSVVLAGTVADMAKAFHTTFARYASPRGEYRGRSGVVRLPHDVAPVVQAVLGLDDRPQAHPQIRAAARAKAAHHAGSFTPPEIARAYNFPGNLEGHGQRIAVIELGGGYRTSQLRSYFSSLGLDMPRITAVSVDGVRNRPGVDEHADSEVMLDIEVIGAVAPAAELLVYFAPLTDRGFVDAVTTAVFD